MGTHIWVGDGVLSLDRIGLERERCSQAGSSRLLSVASPSRPDTSSLQTGRTDLRPELQADKRGAAPSCF